MEIVNKIIKYCVNQKVWLALIIVVVSLLVYGELTATRLFDTTSVENWNFSNSGGRTGIGGTHHK